MGFPLRNSLSKFRFCKIQMLTSCILLLERLRIFRFFKENIFWSIYDMKFPDKSSSSKLDKSNNSGGMVDISMFDKSKDLHWNLLQSLIFNLIYTDIIIRFLYKSKKILDFIIWFSNERK